jgi:hypothetical protein
MNEMDLLTRLRDEVPLTDPSPNAQRAFRAGVAGLADAGRHRRTRRPRLRALSFHGRMPLIAGATAVAVGVTAGLVVLALPSDGRPSTAARAGSTVPIKDTAPTATTVPTATTAPTRNTAPTLPTGTATTPISAQLLADVAASAVLAQPAVKPTQWVYRKVENSTWLPPGLAQRQHRSRWVTVESTWEMADGAHWYSPGPSQGAVGPDLPYSQIGSLPANPVALDAYLAHLDYPNANATTANKATAEFSNIEEMLAVWVLPPKLTAELYHALADIPTVIAETNVKDIAGQVGLAFILPQNGQSMNEEIFLRRSDYRMLGDSVWLTGGPVVLHAQAVLAQAFVSGSGKLP